MTETEFMYMGKQIVIRNEHPDAVVVVDGREFRCHHHHPEEGAGLAMWMCEEAYFMSPELQELARHFADYGYMFDSPGRVAVDDQGKVVDQVGHGGGHEHPGHGGGPEQPEPIEGGDGHHEGKGR